MAYIRIARRGAYFRDGWSCNAFVFPDGTVDGEARHRATDAFTRLRYEIDASVYADLRDRLRDLLPEDAPDAYVPLALIKRCSEDAHVFYMYHRSRYAPNATQVAVWRLVDTVFVKSMLPLSNTPS